MIGKRHHRVSIQENTPTRIKGVRTDSWNEVDEVWAEIKTMGGAERQSADQKESVVTHEIHMRFRAASISSLFEFIYDEIFHFISGPSFQFIFNEVPGFVQSKYRIVFGSTVFDVRGVVHPDPRRETTIMRVQEVVT